MLYYSTKDHDDRVSLKEAILNSGGALDGLYMPERLPNIPRAFFNNFGDMSLKDISYVISNQLFGRDIDSARLKQIVDQAINFDAPIKKLKDNVYVLELFHGPTMAFKDFGARFMAKMFELNGWLRSDKKLAILVATTGNTGAAIANAFAGLKNLNVYILFPKGRSTRQLEAQFTTLGGNIFPIEVSGTIDDCRRLVAMAFNDKSLSNEIWMTSANSANIARLLPQTFYYFYGIGKLIHKIGVSRPISISVPCGNLGNLVGAVMSKLMGLPVNKIIACENSNNQFYNYVVNGSVSPTKAIPTLAYAADKGFATNFQRLLSLYGDSKEALCKDVVAHWSSDADIITTINSTFDETGYMCDPHTALAYAGLKKELKDNEVGLFLATAHPAKSVATMNAITGRAMDLPLQMTRFMTGTDHRVKIPATYNILKQIILEHV